MTLTPEILSQYNLSTEGNEKAISQAVANLNSGEVVLLGVSGKKGAGKDTFAEGLKNLIEERDNKPVLLEAFGNPLKGEATSMIMQIEAFLIHDRTTYERDFLKRFAAINSVSVAQAKEIYTLMKPALERPHLKKIDGWTRSAEVWDLLRLLGTDIRQPQDKLYWVRRVCQTICVNASNGISTIVSDVRFLHEVKALQAIGGYVARIDVSPEVQAVRLGKRDNVKASVDATVHSSETQLDAYEDFNIRINNDSDGGLDVKLAEIYVDWSNKRTKK